MKIVAPSPIEKLTNEHGILQPRAAKWTREVTRLSILEGAGSPEAVQEALPTRLYMDTSGTAGSILYVKRDANIAGDKTKGWILV